MSVLSTGSRSNKFLSYVLSAASLLPGGCAAFRGERGEAPAGPADVAAARNEAPIPTSPLVSGSFSSTFKNRYVGGGFFIGEGPVQQSSATLDVNRGPLDGFSGFAWSNYDYAAARHEDGLNEVDIGASFPLFRTPVGPGSVEVRLGAQHWMFPTDLLPNDATVGDLSVSYAHPSGFTGTILGRHLFRRGEIDSGEYGQLDLTQRLSLGEWCNLSLGVRAGKGSHFFGSNGWYATPGAGVTVSLGRNMSLSGEAGYQVSDGSMQSGPIWGFGMAVSF